MGVYKRGGIYYVRFQVDGKTFNQSTRNKNKKAAEKLEETLKKRELAKMIGVQTNMPLAQAIADYIKHMRAGNTALKKNSIKRFKVSFRQIALFLSGDMVSDVNKEWVNSYVKWRRKEQPSITNRTLRRDLDALSSVFNFLINESAIKRNFVRDYKIKENLPEKKEEIRVPSTEEIQKIINDIGPMAGRLVAFQALTGLRQQEALRLEWRDVALSTSRIIVPKSKTSSPRAVVLFIVAKKLLEDLPKPPKGDYVFWHYDGERYKQFSSQWSSYVKRLELPIRDHDLRHYFAKLHTMKGGTLGTLKEQMGHKWYETTLQYAHLSNDLVENEMRKMGEYEHETNYDANVEFTFPDSWKYKQQVHPGWPWKKREDSE